MYQVCNDGDGDGEGGAPANLSILGIGSSVVANVPFQSITISLFFKGGSSSK